MTETRNLTITIKALVDTDAIKALVDKQMRLRIAQAKADALIEFSQTLPYPWTDLTFYPGDLTIARMLEQRADEIIREVSDPPHDLQVDREWVQHLVRWAEGEGPLDFHGAKVPDHLRHMLEATFISHGAQ